MQQQGYSAYVIGDDGHVHHRIDVICDNDDEAKRWTKELVDGHTLELWHEARLIATFQPQKNGS
jgi:hypothetical protein